MAEPLISRVYSLSISGYDDSIQKLQTLTEAFQKLDATKVKLNAQLAQKQSIGDQDGVAALIQRIKDLEIELEKLKIQRDATAKETLALSQAEKNTAQAILATEKATIATAKAEQIRTQTLSLENKERQRQLEFNDRQRLGLEKEKLSVDNLTIAYNTLKAQRLALEKLTASPNISSTVTVNNQTLSYTEALSKIQQLKVEEQSLIEQLKVEKSAHDDINKTQQQEIILIQEQRLQLETLISAKNSNISFAGQSITNDQALAKIQELRNQEQLLTEQLNNEKSVRQSTILTEEEKLNVIRQERIELEKFAAASSKTTVISFAGENLNLDQSIQKLQQLKAEEADFIERLKIEKSVQDQNTLAEEQKIVAIRQQRIELQNLVNSSQGSSVNFAGESISNEEALIKISQLREEEQLLTNQLIDERNVRQSLIQTEEQRLAVIRQERIELETIINDSAKSSTVSLSGQSISTDDALNRIKELRSQEQQFLEQLRIEKTVQEDLVLTQQSKINALRAERFELENIVKNSNQASTVSFRGTDLSQSEALIRINQLKTEEQQLTAQQNSATQALLSTNRQLTVIEKEEANQSLVDNREKLLQLRAEQEALDKLAETEKQRSNAANEVLPGTFTPGTPTKPAIVPAFIPTNNNEASILALVEDQRQLKQLQEAQKALTAELKAGNISQAEYDTQIVKSIAIQNDLKASISATTAELKAQAKSNLAIPNTIEDLSARNAILSKQASQIPVVNASQEDIASLKTINDEIDQNNELIRVNRDLLAQQKINIGNYTQSFKSSLTVLETELTAINTKLKTGGLGGIEVEDLTKKQTVLTNAITLATRETSSATQATKNYKQAAEQVGLAFGTNSQVFKNFTAQVAASKAPLDNVTSSINKTVEGGNKLPNVFQKAYSGLRQLANLIPGLGISSLILLLITPLETLAASIFKTGERARFTKGSIEELTLRYKEMGEAIKGSEKEFEGAVKIVEELRENIDLARQGFLNKDEVLKQYNDTIGKTTGQVKSLDEAELGLIRNGDAYIQMMLLKAASNIALEGAAKKAFEAEEARRKKDSEFINPITDAILTGENVFGNQTDAQLQEAGRQEAARGKARKDNIIKNAEEEKKLQFEVAADFRKQAADIAKQMGFDFSGTGNFGGAIQKLKDQISDLKKQQLTLIDPKSIQDNVSQIKNLEEQIKKLGQSGGIIQEIQNKISKLRTEQPGLTSNEAIQKNVAEIKKLEAELDRLQGKTAQARNSRLTVPENDAVKIAEANRDKELAVENLKIALLREKRKTTLDEERQHLITIQKINDEADIKKINSIKGNNAAEIAERSKLDLQIINRRIQTNTEIQNLFNKQFDEESRTLKKQFETQKSQVDVALSFVLVDRNVNGENKAIAKKNADQKILDETIDYYTRLEELAIENKQSITNIEEEKQKAIADRVRAGLNDDFAIIEAAQKDQQQFATELLNNLKASAANKAASILEDNSLSSLEKARKLHQLELDEQKRFLKEQAENDENALLLLKANAGTKAEIAAAEAKLQQSKLELAKFVSDSELGYLGKLVDGFKNVLHNITDFIKGVKTAEENKKALDEALSATQDIIKNAVNDAKQSFFENEKEQVDQEKAVALERLNIQEQQAVNLAQSENEKDSIHRQFEARRKDEEKKAGEEKKKIALTQIAIDFGVAVVKTLAAYPFPFSLIPIAGLTIAYFLQRANVQKQQFAGGGYTGHGKEKDSTGHRVAGVVHEHEWVSPKWMVEHPTYGPVIKQLEDERKKGSRIIRREEITAQNIFSREIKGYASGGFTGTDIPGAILQPPINPSSFLNPKSSGANNDQDKIFAAINQQTENINTLARQTNQRIDKIQVLLDPNAVRKANDKTKKASAIGTL